MATRTLKPETQIKKQMEAFIASYGAQEEIDVSLLSNHTRFVLIPPNRFGQGYIRAITSTTVWSADLTKKDPTKTNTPRARAIADL
jgi:hypothetical protein